jgi:hypothetical protein
VKKTPHKPHPCGKCGATCSTSMKCPACGEFMHLTAPKH